MLALHSSCPHSPHSLNNLKLAKHQHLTRPLRPCQAPTIKCTLFLGFNNHMSTFVCTVWNFPLFLCVANSALDFMLPKAMPNFTFELAFSVQLIHCFIQSETVIQSNRQITKLVLFRNSSLFCIKMNLMQSLRIKSQNNLKPNVHPRRMDMVYYLQSVEYYLKIN